MLITSISKKNLQRFSRTLEKLVPKIVSYGIFFKNTEKETANQTVELISKKIKNKNFGKKTDFFKKITNTTKNDFLIFIPNQVSTHYKE